jgi:hypothetical protein
MKTRMKDNDTVMIYAPYSDHNGKRGVIKKIDKYTGIVFVSIETVPGKIEQQMFTFAQLRKVNNEQQT